MELALHSPTGSKPQPAQSLASFNRLLNTALAAPAVESSSARFVQENISKELRVLLAELENEDQIQAERARQEIDRKLLTLGTSSGNKPPHSKGKELESLVFEMPSGSALLAYYLRDDSSWLWLATRSRVQIYPLGSGAAIKRVLSQVRSNMRVVGYDGLDEELSRAGELLLGAIEQELPRTIYLLSVGDLAGFPFEAVKRGGRHFAQDHDLINVLSLDALNGVAQAENHTAAWQKILIAGNPVGKGDGLVALPSSELELGGLAKIFDGKSVTRIERDSLDEQDLVRNFTDLFSRGFLTESL